MCVSKAWRTKRDAGQLGRTSWSGHRWSRHCCGPSDRWRDVSSTADAETGGTLSGDDFLFAASVGTLAGYRQAVEDGRSKERNLYGNEDSSGARSSRLLSKGIFEENRNQPRKARFRNCCKVLTASPPTGASRTGSLVPANTGETGSVFHRR